MDFIIFAIDPLAAKQLADSTYVDNGASGGTKEEVDMMVGSQDNPSTIAQILSLEGFAAKAYVVGGQCSEEEAETLGGKFLGISYDPFTDKILATISPKEKRNGKRIDKETRY